MALAQSANPSGCYTTGLYISCSRGPPLSGGDYPQKKHGKAVYTHNGRNGCLQASHRLSALPCLPVSSINRRPRKSEIRWSEIRELYQPNRKKVIYLHHLKNSINSFYPSILWQEKKEEEERTRPRDLRARCALCKPRRKRYTLAREISQRAITATGEDQDEQSDSRQRTGVRYVRAKVPARTNSKQEEKMDEEKYGRSDVH